MEQDNRYTFVYDRIYNAYEGAGINYKTGLKGLLDGEADQLAVRELRYLQERSEHAIRNNGYARTALNRWVTNASAIKIVWEDEKGKSHKLMQDLWDEFTDNPNYDNIGTYNNTQGISNSSIFISGASHIRKIIKRKGNKNKIPLKLQHIPTRLHALEWNNQISSISPNEMTRYGITFIDSLPKSYWYKQGLLEQTWNSSLNNVIEVPANEMVHTFIRDTPGQWLGIPLLSSVLLSLYELDELIEATVSKQKASQVISTIIENANNTVDMLIPGAPMVGNNLKGEEKIVIKGQGGGVQYLNKGESVKWFQGGDIGANFKELITMELRKIACTSDLMLHELNNDTSSLNFSALMGLSILSRNRIEYLHNFLFIPLREKPIAESFKEFSMLYYPKTKKAFPRYQLPRWRGIDELKDIQADLLAVQNGMDTYKNVLAERGLGFEDILADRQTISELETFGIYLNSAGGAKQQAQAKNIKANNNTTGV